MYIDLHSSKTLTHKINLLNEDKEMKGQTNTEASNHGEASNIRMWVSRKMIYQCLFLRVMVLGGHYRKMSWSLGIKQPFFLGDSPRCLKLLNL